MWLTGSGATTTDEAWAAARQAEAEDEDGGRGAYLFPRGVDVCSVESNGRIRRVGVGLGHSVGCGAQWGPPLVNPVGWGGVAWRVD